MSPGAAFLRFVVGTAPVAVLVLLATSDFFAAWDGQAVSVRPALSEDPVSRTVLITDAGGAIERQWPTALAAELKLPVDALAIPPTREVPDRPKTNKRRFTLHYLVEMPEGYRVIPTTSPQALGLGLLAWGLLIAVRNMVVGGAPWSITPRERYQPEVQVKSGQVVTKTYSKPKKTHPPRSGRR